MKPRKVKTKMIRLLSHYGTMQTLVDTIGIELSHGYKLVGSENNPPIVPGKFLYPVICKLYRDVFPERASK